jgi:CRISPR-associated protein Cas5t
MIGLYLSVPVACFRKGMAREYLETEVLPPPATCYGFLLSLVGETKRRAHLGSRVAPVLLSACSGSVVLRTVWRQKTEGLGNENNLRPDFQQLLTGIELLVWLDSSEEEPAVSSARLEQRVYRALTQPQSIERFGGLCLGESTHLVDEVRLFDDSLAEQWADRSGQYFLLADQGRLTLPVWVDHVGSAGTRYATGNLETQRLTPPPVERMPRILP